MPSSDPARFLRSFAVALCAGAAALLTLTALVDPFAALGPLIGKSPLCPAGIKDPQHEEDSKFLLPITRQPQLVLAGTSRIAMGFDQRSLDGFAAQPAVNLGIAGASMADIARVIRLAMARAPVKTIVIGTDFASFLMDPDSDRVPQVAADQGNRWLLLRYGLLNPHALAAASLSALDCGKVSHTINGAQLPSTRGVTTHDTAQVIAEFTVLRGNLGGAAKRQQKRNIAANLENFARLAAQAKAQGIRMVVLIGPTRSRYRQELADAGRIALFERWQAAVKALAETRSAAVIDGDSPQFGTASGLPACPGEARLDCYFPDAVHYSPVMGDALVRAIKQRLAQPM